MPARRRGPPAEVRCDVADRYGDALAVPAVELARLVTIRLHAQRYR
ncbi:MAG TPA: hypothetical protein VGD67_15940 [Pseudonocardiaceae bacterium]